MGRFAMVLLLVLASLAASTTAASADGEAGLVIDFGNGQTQTFCLAFTGSDMSGQQALQKAGVSVNQFSGLVCSLDGTGCQQSGTFDSCTCQCKSGGSDCTYWAFFSQRYGASWVYSATGYQLARVKDGDLQAWKWGKGSVSSAPPPAGLTFEQVCGHSPQGGTNSKPTATLVIPAATSPTVPVTLAATTAATTVSPLTPVITITAAATASLAATSSTAETSPAPATTSGTTQASASTPSVTSPSPSPSAPSALPPASGGSANESDGGGVSSNLIAFAGIAGVLCVAIAFALLRSRRS